MHGLGLRRVEWSAAKGNEASVRAAERMGFKSEGIIRWYKVVCNEDQKRPEPRKGDSLEGRLRSDFADDWEGGGREKVQAILERNM